MRRFLSLGPYPLQPAFGHLRGFGCVPGLSPGVAPDGDDARSPPPPPRRRGGPQNLAAAVRMLGRGFV